MDKNLSNRFKQLIGESIAGDKKPLLSSENVTDEKLAARLAESEAKKKELTESEKAEMKELYEGWDEDSEIEVNSEETIEEGDCKCGECPECKEKDSMNESKEIVYDLSFLKEGK